jgi:hypothetical protein
LPSIDILAAKSLVQNGPARIASRLGYRQEASTSAAGSKARSPGPESYPLKRNETWVEIGERPNSQKLDVPGEDLESRSGSLDISDARCGITKTVEFEFRTDRLPV